MYIFNIMDFTTERLKLRPVHIDDKESLFEYRSDSIANMYQGWIPGNIKDVEDFIMKIPAEINQPETWFQLAILLKETDKLIGDIGIHFMDKANMQAEIGCTLNKKYQSNGYATEALRKVIDYLFFDLNKHRIIASIDPENVNSIRLVERLGFRKEAHFIESLQLNGGWADDLIYAILKREWKVRG